MHNYNLTWCGISKSIPLTFSPLQAREKSDIEKHIGGIGKILFIR